MPEPSDAGKFKSFTPFLGPLLRAMRVNHWLKNVLVLLPLALSHNVRNPHKLTNSLVAFLAFCFVASAIYLLNDLIDIDADRAHPRKRSRPFAAGTLPIQTGLIAAIALLVVGMALAFAVNRPFVLALLLYAGL